MFAQFHIVEVRGAAHPVDGHQFVLRVMQLTHAGIGLVPDAEDQQGAIEVTRDGRDIIHVAPVHANEVYGARP